MQPIPATDIDARPNAAEKVRLDDETEIANALRVRLGHLHRLEGVRPQRGDIAV